ncbi:MAG: DUF2788 domain-containing protein [Pseudomonadota bacterium]
MDIETFESWSLTVGVTVLIGWMLLIIWKMGKESKAGKFGYLVLFIALGLGLIGFIAKTILVELMER